MSDNNLYYEYGGRGIPHLYSKKKNKETILNNFKAYLLILAENDQIVELYFRVNVPVKNIIFSRQRG